MSIFAINYLHDISQHDQSLVDLQQKDLRKLKQQTKKNKEKYRSTRNQSLTQANQQTLLNRISFEENQILQDALKYQQNQTEQIPPSFNKLVQQNQIKNAQLQEVPQNQTSMKNPTFINSQIQDKQSIESIRQKAYKEVIQRRYQRLKKANKRDYFNVHFDI